MPDCAAIYEQFYTRISFRKRRDHRAQVRTGKILVGRSFNYGVNAATSERLQFYPEVPMESGPKGRRSTGFALRADSSLRRRNFFAESPRV